MTDQLLVQYLLGLLPPEDADRIDEASIADDEIAARLRRVEHDLVDAYVRGSLAGDTLTRFEAHYLSSARRREYVTFARRFVPAVDRAAAPPGVATTRHSMLSFVSRRSMLAVAAALLVAFGALLFETVRLSRMLNVARSERVALDRRTRELERQVADLGATTGAGAAGEPEPARAGAAGATPGAPLIALLLLPQTRSLGPIPTAPIPPGVDRIALELRLESDDFPRYQVALRDPAANTIVWRSGWMAAMPSDGEPSLRVAVPTGVLRPQHYSLDLRGRRPGGGSEVLGSYAFEIVPK